MGLLERARLIRSGRSEPEPAKGSLPADLTEDLAVEEEDLNWDDQSEAASESRDK
jgi:hypothetical protein